MMWTYFLVQVDMNYLIATTVDNMTVASYRLILHTPFHIVVFIFNINRKTANDYFIKKNFIPTASFIKGKES